MNRKEFIEKYQPGVITTNGTIKDQQWLVDFYALLEDELNNTTDRYLKIINEAHAKTH